jgi:hypothetical protein
MAWSLDHHPAIVSQVNLTLLDLDLVQVQSRLGLGGAHGEVLLAEVLALRIFLFLRPSPATPLHPGAHRLVTARKIVAFLHKLPSVEVGGRAKVAVAVA